MQRDKRQIIESLKSKGFREDDTHHKYFCFFTKDGKKTSINTHTSHGAKYKTLTDHLLSQMAKQCRLNKKDFLDLVDCPLSRDEYEKKMDNGNFC